MNDHQYTLLITILPSLVIIAFFIFSDRFKEPPPLVMKVFLLGVLICFPAGYLNGLMYDIFYDGSLFSEDLTSSFLGPAWTEEILKFFILYRYVLREKEFNEPMDGIVYGVVASLGFATYENYDYVFRLAKTYNLERVDLAYIRAFSAVPMHGLNGCIMGFFFGKFVFTGKRRFLSFSLIFPFLFHGAYNFLVPTNYYIVVLLIMLFMALKLHNELKILQKRKTKEHEKKKRFSFFSF